MRTLQQIIAPAGEPKEFEIEISQTLTTEQFGRILATLGRPPANHKYWADFYFFTATPKTLPTLDDYLQQQGIPYTLEVKYEIQ